MSLLSSFIIPKLEAELVSQEPEIAEFIIKQLHELAEDVVSWAQNRMHDKLKS